MKKEPLIRYKHKLKTYKQGLIISTSAGIFHYLLAWVSVGNEWRLYIIPAWWITAFTMQKYVRTYMKNGYIDLNKTHIPYLIGIAASILPVILGQWLFRTVNPEGFHRTIGAVFCGDFLGIALISAIIYLFFLFRMMRKKHDFETRFYTDVGKKLIIGIQSLRNWHEIHREASMLFPDLIEELEGRKDLSEREVRYLVCRKMRFTRQRFMEIEGMTPGAMRTNKSRIKAKLGMDIDDYLRKF